jgi:hypothetical protein
MLANDKLFGIRFVAVVDYEEESQISCYEE